METVRNKIKFDPYCLHWSCSPSQAIWIIHDLRYIYISAPTVLDRQGVSGLLKTVWALKIYLQILSEPNILADNINSNCNILRSVHNESLKFLTGAKRCLNMHSFISNLPRCELTISWSKPLQSTHRKTNTATMQSDIFEVVAHFWYSTCNRAIWGEGR